MTRLALLLSALLAAVVLVAGCGGGSDGSGQTVPDVLAAEERSALDWCAYGVEGTEELAGRPSEADLSPDVALDTYLSDCLAALVVAPDAPYRGTTVRGFMEDAAERLRPWRSEVAERIEETLAEHP